MACPGETAQPSVTCSARAFAASARKAGPLVGGVGVAPAGLPVRVVAGRVEIAVLLRTSHEVQLREPLVQGPRLPVETLGHPAHGGTRPVADHGTGHGAAPHEPPQRLHAVEQAVLADAVQGDRGSRPSALPTARR